MTPTEAKEKFAGVLLLSPREYQVFCLAGKGLHMHQVANRMGVHLSTVHTYVERIRQVFALDGYRRVIALGAVWNASELEREPLLPEDARYKFVEPESPKVVHLKVA